MGTGTIYCSFSANIEGGIVPVPIFAISQDLSS